LSETRHQEKIFPLKKETLLQVLCRCKGASELWFKAQRVRNSFCHLMVNGGKESQHYICSVFSQNHGRPDLPDGGLLFTLQLLARTEIHGLQFQMSILKLLQ